MMRRLQRPPESMSPPPSTLLHIGTAARLPGLQVATLRVWERHQGVVEAAKSAGGQRGDSGHDSSRLKLLCQPTPAGHAIATIATLPLEPLQALSSGLSTGRSDAVPATRTAVVVGPRAVT
jgi:hypothetical protein